MGTRYLKRSQTNFKHRLSDHFTFFAPSESPVLNAPFGGMILQTGAVFVTSWLVILGTYVVLYLAFLSASTFNETVLQGMHFCISHLSKSRKL